METRYNSAYGANLSVEESGKIKELTHCHQSEINYHLYGLFDKKALKQRCDSEKTAVTGCLAFFKVYKDDATQSTEVKAAVAAAIAEDEARLKELEQNRPTSCLLL